MYGIIKGIAVASFLATMAIPGNGGNSDIYQGFQTCTTHSTTVELASQPNPDNQQSLSNHYQILIINNHYNPDNQQSLSNHKIPSLSINGYERHMAGKSMKTVAHV